MSHRRFWLYHVIGDSEADHYNIQRVVDLLVAPSTQDVGGTQAAIENPRRRAACRKE